MHEDCIICVQSTSQLTSFVAIMQNFIEINLLYWIENPALISWYQVWVSYIYTSNDAFKVGSLIFGHYTLEVSFSKLFGCAKRSKKACKAQICPVSTNRIV